jgi:magnesium transporter
LESISVDEACAILAESSVNLILAVWPYLLGDTAEEILRLLPSPPRKDLLSRLEPSQSAQLLARLNKKEARRFLEQLDKPVAQELRTLMAYPADSAGRLMDPRVLAFRGQLTVEEVERRLRERKPRAARELFLIDVDGRPSGRVEIQDLAVADPATPIGQLAQRLITLVQDVTPREEVVEKLEQFKLSALPVVDYDGRLIGVIHHAGLVDALQQEASLDIQTMVGVSKDERALSPISFAVKKRLPWLEINLVTAFLAAAVVGLFESTIAKFTALAVLLPVVAGQSGNAGAQALAVTMRGLAIREIGVRHWFRVMFKEVNVGFFNGIAIALTTAAGVYVWSRSVGLALVIATSMVLAMVAAGFAGALIPIILQRFGQDPAQSSSIILTTVTDVVGFFSFLGIATLLASML